MLRRYIFVYHLKLLVKIVRKYLSGFCNKLQIPLVRYRLRNSEMFGINIPIGLYLVLLPIKPYLRRIFKRCFVDGFYYFIWDFCASKQNPACA